MIKVGVAGYGTIGMRLADGVAQQDDMELRENEFSIADFVEWNEKHLIKNQETDTVISSNIIPFEKWYRGNCHD